MYEEPSSPICVRAAGSADTPEVIRLVAQVYWDMHAVYGGPEPLTDTQWEDSVRDSLERRLGTDVGIFVVDGADGRLASVAVGRISETLPSPRRSNVSEGCIEWVGTDPQSRGHGFANAVTRELLEWFRLRKAVSVSLYASSAAESLYLRMGFDDGDGGPRALSIRLKEDLA